MMRMRTVVAFFAIILQAKGSDGFQSTANYAKLSLHRSNVQLSSVYGRGAEIWPECNEDAVRLVTSFPNGQVPYSAVVILEETAKAESSSTMGDVPEETVVTKRQRASRAIRRILRRAAAREELDSEDQSSAISIDRAPSLLALALVFGGFVNPLDIMLVSFLTAYFVMLGMVAQAPREASGVPILPGLPPQGHVPTIVSTPLGQTFTSSKAYGIWLKLGITVGVLGPVALLGKHLLTNDLALARACARPLFILCIQAISEAFSRRSMAPLPIRILIPVAYNSARLIFLWNWATSSLTLGLAGRVLAVSNAIYWGLNLFAFLIPIASLRYMRAHFFGVEASEVRIRPGLEETIGLIPR